MRISSHELKIPGQIEITFLNYGGIIQKLKVPDKNNHMGDVVLGFDDPELYQKQHPYFGALVGRYANRIAEGRFLLHGKQYHLSVNNGPNSLHGGLVGFDRVFWDVQRMGPNSFQLRHLSPDGHEGYPGNLEVVVNYTVTSRRDLIIEYMAKTDAPTVLNLTNHSYFNLSGSGTILDHELWIDSDRFTAVDENLTPTGETPDHPEEMNFKNPKPIGLDLKGVSGGYDHNYILNQSSIETPKARLIDHKSGRKMEVFTDQPGIQFYSGNFLDGSLVGKNNLPYVKHAGLCLETQRYPDSPNHKNFPSTELLPGKTFHSVTIYRFTSV